MAPRPKTMEEFIKIVEKIETEFKGKNIIREQFDCYDGPGNSVRCIKDREQFDNNSYLHVTRLRKYWYDGPSWNNLVVKRSNVPGFSSGDIEPKTSKELLGLLAPMGQKKHSFDVPEPIVPPLVYKSEDVSLPHVFTGLDSQHYPGAAGYISSESKGVLGISAKLQSPAAATWAGDLGQALASYGLKDQLSEVKGKTIEDVMRIKSPRSELIGDIDGIVMGANKNFTSNVLLSKMLKDYYFGISDVSSRKRYGQFIKAYGMSFTAGSYELSQSSKDFIALQTDIFAAKWETNISKRNYFKKGVHYTKDDLDFVVGRFVGMLEDGLKKESV